MKPYLYKINFEITVCVCKGKLLDAELQICNKKTENFCELNIEQIEYEKSE